MSGVLIHSAFDVLAWLAAGLAGLWVTRVEKITFPAVSTDLPYVAAVLLGAGLGAYAFGTANMWLSGVPGIGRSIEGALAGGIIAVELYKRAAHIRMRTGARFALPLAVGVAIGRIGCYFAGGSLAHTGIKQIVPPCCSWHSCLPADTPTTSCWLPWNQYPAPNAPISSNSDAATAIRTLRQTCARTSSAVARQAPSADAFDSRRMSSSAIGRRASASWLPMVSVASVRTR